MDEGLTCRSPARDVKAAYSLEITTTKIVPEKNTRLEGLYMSGGIRTARSVKPKVSARITYYPRPAGCVELSYTVPVWKPAWRNIPVLLSNGNKTVWITVRLNMDGISQSGTTLFPSLVIFLRWLRGICSHIQDDIRTPRNRAKRSIFIFMCARETRVSAGMRWNRSKKSMKWDEDVVWPRI